MLESLSLLLVINYKMATLVIVQCLLNFLVIRSRKKFLLWIFNIAIMFLIHVAHLELSRRIELKYPLFVMQYFMLLTLTLKGLSSGLDLQKRREHISFKDFIHYLGYMLYWPNMIFGPVIFYSDFEEVYRKRPNNNKCSELLKLSINMVKYVGYYYFLEFLHHYLYKSMVLQPMYFEDFTFEAVVGHFFLATIDFNVKVMIFYGTAICTARAEGITTANSPGCFFSISCYSYMWKHLDEGTHSFRKRFV